MKHFNEKWERIIDKSSRICLKSHPTHINTHSSTWNNKLIDITKYISTVWVCKLKLFTLQVANLDSFSLHQINRQKLILYLNIFVNYMISEWIFL